MRRQRWIWRVASVSLAGLVASAGCGQGAAPAPGPEPVGAVSQPSVTTPQTQLIGTAIPQFVTPLTTSGERASTGPGP